MKHGQACLTAHNQSKIATPKNYGNIINKACLFIGTLSTNTTGKTWNIARYYYAIVPLSPIG